MLFDWCKRISVQTAEYLWTSCLCWWWKSHIWGHHWSQSNFLFLSDSFILFLYFLFIFFSRNILCAFQVVQKGIGHSPEEVTSALSSTEKKTVSDMKDTLKTFQLFLAKFEVVWFCCLNFLQAYFCFTLEVIQSLWPLPSVSMWCFLLWQLFD